MRQSGHFAEFCGRTQHQIRSSVYGLLIVLAVIVAGSGARAAAQALPAAEASPVSTGFSLPTTSGTLSYALSGSEDLSWGFFSNNGGTESTNLSGDLGYLSNSKRDPFSAVLTGGRSFGTGGQPSYNFVGAGLSQVIAVKRWTYVLSDNVSYLPQTPAVGFSGLPGLGDIGISPVLLGVIPTSTIATPAQGILTNYEQRVENTASGSFSRDFTAKTSAHGTGAYSIARFMNDTAQQNPGGIDYDVVSGGGGIYHAYTRRTTIGGDFEYSDFTYLRSSQGLPTPEIKSQTATIVFEHQYTRKFSLNAAGGPQWTTVDVGNVPSTSISAFANVTASYRGEVTQQTLNFVRTTNAGYGVIGGGLSNSVAYTATRKFGGGLWLGGLNASYTDTKSLPSPLLPSVQFHTGIVGAQVSRALPHSLSGFASYSLQSQTDHGAFLTLLNAFSGQYQTLAFGITYSPMPIHFGH